MKLKQIKETSLYFIHAIIITYGLFIVFLAYRYIFQVSFAYLNGSLK